VSEDEAARGDALGAFVGSTAPASVALVDTSPSFTTGHRNDRMYSRGRIVQALRKVEGLVPRRA
jgi:hypothetical protein